MNNYYIYEQLMRYRPRAPLYTWNKIDRSQTISYRIGHMTVVCTKYTDGKTTVNVRGDIANQFGVKFRLFNEQITGGLADIIYNRAKRYCR